MISNASISIPGQQFSSESGWVKAIQKRLANSGVSFKIISMLVISLWRLFLDLKVWIHIAFAKYLISFSFLYGCVCVYICVRMVRAYQQTALAKVVTALSANSFKKWFISWTGRFSSNRVLSKSSLQIQETIVPPTGSCICLEDEPSPRTNQAI